MTACASRGCDLYAEFMRLVVSALPAAKALVSDDHFSRAVRVRAHNAAALCGYRVTTSCWKLIMVGSEYLLSWLRRPDHVALQVSLDLIEPADLKALQATTAGKDMLDLRLRRYGLHY